MRNVETHVIREKFERIHGRVEHIAENLPFASSPKEWEETALPSEVGVNLGVMDRSRIVEAFRPIPTHRKLIGPCIIFVKKVLRRVIKWYIEPLFDQQTRFNNAVTPVVGKLTETVAKLAHNQELLRNKGCEYKLLDDPDFLAVQERQQSFSLRDEPEYQVLLDRLKNAEIAIVEATTLAKDAQRAVVAAERIVETYVQREVHQLDTRLEATGDRLNYLCEELDILETPSLSIFDKKTYSQSGEDAISQYILHVMGFQMKNVRYLDLGANHAKELSNTYLLYRSGARGVLVEANPQLIRELQTYRRNDVILNRLVSGVDNEETSFYILSGDGLSTDNYQTAQEFIEKNPMLSITGTAQVQSIRVSTIVDQYMEGKAPDLLSVDVEGNDLAILESCDLGRMRPLIVIVEMIEYRPYIGVFPKNKSIQRHMSEHRYVEYAFTGINSIFVDADRLPFEFAELAKDSFV